MILMYRTAGHEFFPGENHTHYRARGGNEAGVAFRSCHKRNRVDDMGGTVGLILIWSLGAVRILRPPRGTMACMYGYDIFILQSTILSILPRGGTAEGVWTSSHGSKSTMQFPPKKDVTLR